MMKQWAPKVDWGDDTKTVITELDSDQPKTVKKAKKPKKTSKDRPSGRKR